ncbi:ubiquitin-related domain-containing protein [Suillus subalutaceus]|uniref:ubiquitin-related domain-containing protein n=1 Tax=Suillus subalutaceus TaxID=48586 RepID=UPI001B869443|nr:ubiquitin-related domain-containing protein [Suillus subalutaceus]KAG1867173.1 ubiquitin-related domain-containing protein [Suillus subalutaceus]
MENQTSSDDPPSSPPQPDSSERPATAHASASPSLGRGTSYPSIPPPAERPFTVHGTSNTPRGTFAAGPYNSASARTSFTHVDVDSAPTFGAYPPLPNSNLGQAAPDIAVNNAEAVVPPAVDGPTAPENLVPQTPQVSLTFLLVSGRRRTMSFDPAITIGRVKELVWNAWPADWQDESPQAPSHLRILYLGKILQDEDNLTREHTNSSSLPTIVHLSIRPSNISTVDDTMKKRRLSNAFSRRGAINNDTEIAREGADNAVGSGSCCGCIIC